MEEPITIASYPTVQEALVAKSMLEANGIPALVKHEHISTLLPMHGLYAAGIELQVDVQDAFQALALLEDEQKGLSNTLI